MSNCLFVLTAACPLSGEVFESSETNAVEDAKSCEETYDGTVVEWFSYPED